MLNLIHADLYKLRKSTGAKICFIITCICAVAFVYVAHCIAIGKLSSNVSGSASGLADPMLIWLFGSLMAGILVCSDFETKTIHGAVSCGRINIVISKALVYFIIIILLVLPYMLVTIVGFCSGEKFGTPFVGSVFLGILANGSGLTVTVTTICKIIVVSLVEMILYTAELSICLPLAFKIRKPIVVMAIGFSFGFLANLIIMALQDVPVLKYVIKNTPYYFGLNIITVKTAAGTLLKVTIISIVFFTIMVAITHLLFRRSEIK